MKTEPDETSRFRARLVCRGFKDNNAYDVSEIYAPVCEVSDVRVILSSANKFDYEIRHLDITTAFLNGILEHDVYMKFPDGHPRKDELQNSHVLKLKRSLYGLRVAPKRWFERFRTALAKLEFKPFWLKPCIFVWRKNQQVVIIALYVDDILLVSNCPPKINDVIALLRREFKVKDLGVPQVLLGIEVDRTRSKKTIFLHQSKYILSMLSRFTSWDLPETSTPMLSSDALRKLVHQPATEPSPDQTLFREAVGSLIYLANGTRPDISFAVNVVSRAQSSPTFTDWKAVLRIFSYLRKNVRCTEK